MSLYKLENIGYSYEWQKKQVAVLTNLNLEIAQGSFACLVGPSGTGKTTLLNLMGLVDLPTEGKLTLDGQIVSSLTEKEREHIRLFQLGFVFQAFYLIPTLTVLENTTYFLATQGVSHKNAIKKGHEVLELVGLKEHAQKLPLELSGGQRQRVAIARALAKSPKVILADEPTANLDQKTAEDIIKVFQFLRDKSGVSFVFSTHDPHLLSYANEVFHMAEGKVKGGV